ncbi:o-succinylbenzoate synthase [Candidatus Kapabacteria bacterium]|nr:o-succinylbenzoate synthase [Candidatus Kapabacteria bacterium]
MIKAKKIIIYSYKLPFKKALLMKDKKSLFRQGYLINIYWEDGINSWGEIAPFIGLHNEIYEDIPTHFKYLLDNINSINNYQLPSSIAISIEMAKAFKGKSSLVIDNKLKICPLLSGNKDDIIEEAKRLTNIESVKLKLGRKELNYEIDLFNSLVNELPMDVKIRCDINRKWKYEDAIHFAGSVDKTRIEYLEEPLIDFNRLPDFYEDTNLNYAIDETIYEINNSENIINDLSYFSSASAFIIKPSLFTSVNQLELIYNKFKSSKSFIFSSAFESGYSMLYYFYLYGIYRNNNKAQGFDTLKWLADDLLKSRINNQFIYDKGSIFKLDIDSSKLTEIFSDEI